MEIGEVTPRMRQVSVHRILSTLMLLMPVLWRARLIREVIFSESFGLSLNPVPWGSSKVRSSMAATGAGEDFFLLALVIGFRLATFQPSGAGEAATDAKDLDGPLGGGGRGLGGLARAGAAGGFAVGLCLEAERSGVLGGGGGGEGGGGGGGCCCGGVDAVARVWSDMVTSLEIAVGGGLGMATLCLGAAGAASCLGEFTFSQIFSSSSCCWRLRFASLIS